MAALKFTSSGELYESSVADFDSGIVPHETTSPTSQPLDFPIPLIDAYVSIYKGNPLWRTEATSSTDIVSERRRVAINVALRLLPVSWGIGFFTLRVGALENMLPTGNEVRRTGSANLSREPPSDVVEMSGNALGDFSSPNLRSMSEKKPIMADWNVSGEAGNYAEFRGHGGIITFCFETNTAMMQTSASAFHALKKPFLELARQVSVTLCAPPLVLNNVSIDGDECLQANI
ncbi:hypothetical protein PILCRDRAFT_8975 [Piloderma croceum F 1598]|uniref:Uncharacterized protein n=1 Tax=Piloderma croceum (strain F 1598) TaxID=765440 RepID=A0A0C3FNJ2_PILCF|nr:hypothetical protein PILCRDRAFT_8975 [Piloderma croceum F 1598]